MILSNNPSSCGWFQRPWTSGSKVPLPYHEVFALNLESKFYYIQCCQQQKTILFILKLWFKMIDCKNFMIRLRNLIFHIGNHPQKVWIEERIMTLCHWTKEQMTWQHSLKSSSKCSCTNETRTVIFIATIWKVA